MPFILNQEETKTLFIRGLFDNNDKYFNISDSSSLVKDIRVQYILDVEDEYKVEDFELYLFRRNETRENDIFQVYEKLLSETTDGRGRIGWMFPIQSLNSKQHDKADNVHFLKYAYVAFKKLIEGDFSEEIYYLENKPVKEIYTIEDFFEDNTVIIVLCKERLKEIDGFNFEHYLPSLYSYGYVSYNGYNHAIGFNSDMITETELAMGVENKEYTYTDRINIQGISKHIKEYAYIKSLYSSFLPREKHSLVRFHLLYQVIELLIGNILKVETKKILLTLSGEYNLYDTKEKLNEIWNEQFRINKLFKQYITSIPNRTKLIDECNYILKDTLRGKQEDEAKAIYNVRNYLFHEFRSVSTSQLHALIGLNKEFEKAILSLLYQYKGNIARISGEETEGVS